MAESSLVAKFACFPPSASMLAPPVVTCNSTSTLLADAAAVAEREATEAAADRAEKEVEAASSHHTLRSLGCRTRLVARAQRRRASEHTAASTQTGSAAHRGDQTRRSGRARPSPSAPDTLPHPSAGTACPCRRRRPCTVSRRGLCRAAGLGRDLLAVAHTPTPTSLLFCAVAVCGVVCANETTPSPPRTQRRVRDCVGVISQWRPIRSSLTFALCSACS